MAEVFFKKGPVTDALGGTVNITTTGSEINCIGYNAILVSSLIAGTGTWKIDVRGRFDSSGTVMDIYDNSDTQLTTGNITTSKIRLFVGIPDYITILATEVSDGATCQVRIQPINV